MKKLLLLCVVFSSFCLASQAKTSVKHANKTLSETGGMNKLGRSTISPIDFYLTNTGIFGHNVNDSSSGCVWPRDSVNNHYIYGMGLWIGAIKDVHTIVNGKDSIIRRKLTSMTYNPSDGSTMYMPGLMNRFTPISKPDTNKYRLYFSTDMNLADGTPKTADYKYNWPIWTTNNGATNFAKRANGYIDDVDKRNLSSYPLGPSFASNEDIVSCMNDLDLDSYPFSADSARSIGFPLELEIIQKVYSWADTSEFKNFAVIAYKIINQSQDTLHQVYLGEVCDFDIFYSNMIQGAVNDYMKTFTLSDSTKIAVTWSATDQGEKGHGFGYIGATLLETPSVDANSRILPSNLATDSAQLGVKTMRQYNISDEPKTDGNRYSLLSLNTIQTQHSSKSDVREVVATGAFEFFPGDTANFSVLLVLGKPAKGGEADGTLADVIANDTLSLGAMAKKAKTAYSNKKIPVNVVENTSAKNDYSIYPNPAQNYILIKSFANETVDYKVYSVAGELVLEGSASDKIDVSTLKTGAYILKANKQVYRFVKI